MTYTELKKEFDALNEREQWVWLLKLENKTNVTITLDNDATDICFNDEENNEDTTLLFFKADIGNRQGVYYLLEALGFNVQDV